MMNLPLNIPQDIDKYFYNRKEDLKIMKSYLNMLDEGISNQFLITGYRAVGKTFFLKKLLNDLPDTILTTYVDLSMIYGKEYGHLTEEDVIKELFKEINKSILEYNGKTPSLKEDILNWIKQIPIKDLKFDDPMNFLNISLPSIEENYSKLSEFVLELPQKVVDNDENIHGFVIVIDEFQNLKNLKNPDAFFWLMRSFSQTQHNVSYIFTGSASNTSDILEMINGPTGAYGGRMIQLNLNPFTKEDTYNYINERTDILLDDEAFEEFYKLTRGIPSYINSFSNVLDSNIKYDKQSLKETFLMKIDQINIIWLTIWGTFNSKEKNIIITLFENENMSWNEILTTIDYSKSTILKYMNILINRGIVDHHYNNYSISDNMLKLWLKHKKMMDGHYPR